MAGFRSIKNLVVESEINGKYHSSEFRKQSNIVTTSGIWCDLSMFSGHPVTNFYASSPLIAATLTGREGVQNGSNVSPDYKYLYSACMQSGSAPLTMLACDYLLYYPFIDGDNTDEQTLDNTVTLPRYADGENISAFLVAQGSYTGGQNFTLRYTNSDGVSDRYTNTCAINTAGNTATIGNSGVAANQFGWKIPLQYGDKGIRSIEGITFSAAVGGIFALVLVRPLNYIRLSEASIPGDHNFFIEEGFRLSRVYDGAYINYLACPSGSLSGVLINGYQKFIWG